MANNDSLKPHKRDLLFGIPISSSQESSFEGFGTSPFGKLHCLLYSNDEQQQTQIEQDSPKKNKNLLPPEQKLSPGKLLFSKFYDTVIEENSCNAVDIQMSKDSGNSSSDTRTQSDESYNSNKSDMNSSSELSFNGKIKDLSRTSQNSLGQAEHIRRLSNLMKSSIITSQQFSDSFILKKYTNEKSPDLFGEDEEEEEVEHDEDEVLEENECSKKFKKIPEHTTVLNESQPAALSCNLADNSFNCPTESSFATDDHTIDFGYIQAAGANSSDSYTLFKDNCRREREMLRRMRKCLAGVLPPPSVTIPQLDMVSVVLSKKDDIFNFINDVKDLSSKEVDPPDGSFLGSTKSLSLFKPTHCLAETKCIPWRDVLSVRQHGLCYNLNKASESHEYLSLSVVERFIGAETASSYMNSPSSAKKRSSRLKLLSQSPGNRLSHLAKRRAIFSSANLATQKTSSFVGPQILLDKKKIKNRRKATPKRMTPASKKKTRKIPNSSGRKRIFCNEIAKPGPSRETSKRALFQSPTKHLQLKVQKPPAMKPELANRVEKSKRALLFTPEKEQQRNEKKSNSPNLYFAHNTTTQLDMLLKRKRTYCDDIDDVDTSELSSQSSKLFKTDSTSSLTPRSLKIKSESFCIGAGSSMKHKKQLPYASSSYTTNSNMSLFSISSGSNSQHQLPRSSSVSSLMGSKLQKAYSDNMPPTYSLTENQKKKLLWAVSQALQEKKITTKHEHFKQYASILARVVRRIFQEFYQKFSTSNSETMLRLAKKYVYQVSGGATADDIYVQAKTQLEDSKRQLTRLSGYIGPEEYEQLKQQSSQSSFSQSKSHKGSTCSIFNADNSLDSFGLMSQASSGFCGSINGTTMSQTSFLAQISHDVLSMQNSNLRSATKAIQTNASLQNSSSKSNLCGVVLRENVDCEIRRSGQKNFTGKDQRNVSPYAGNNGSAVKTHTNFISDVAAASGAKARRQISFDS